MSIANPMTNHFVPTAIKTEYDYLLDFVKGVAIILVVLGHTFQNQTSNFDELYGFRFIYSFHMPLFAFLSGAAAAHWAVRLNASGSLMELTGASISRVRKSAVHLLLPFLFWTVVAFFLSGSQESIDQHLRKVFREAHYSLWFLPCIFWCTTFTSLFMLFFSTAKKIFETTRLGKLLRYLTPLPAQMAALLIVWLLFRKQLPDGFGFGFANFFHGGLFFFFLLGLVFFKRFINIRSVALQVFPYVIFLALVPYWHRTLDNNIIQDAPNFLTIGLVAKKYALIVAISGVFAIVDLSRLMYSCGIKWINVSMCFIGRASLGIYAMHFYFIDYKPPVVAAILSSLVLYQLISYIPLVRTIVLGK
ncbi:acyltransferase family protein [Propionivibrio dicarboxylicus]|nr:acyltransferase family protein [Propionivibrio dicarboxylicus]